jgi:hypothetical protein
MWILLPCVVKFVTRPTAELQTSTRLGVNTVVSVWSIEMFALSGQSTCLNPIVHLQSLHIVFCHSEKRREIASVARLGVSARAETRGSLCDRWGRWLGDLP